MTIHNLGFPRIGPFRELKTAVEAYWKEEINQAQLKDKALEIKKKNWQMQKGLDLIPVGDFSFYDHVLDMSALLGVVPERFGRFDGLIDIDTYFHMARGRTKDKADVPAHEMTKWFDTNYHYMVPELHQGLQFKISDHRLFNEIAEALALNLQVKPVLLGPLSYLWLGKIKGKEFNKLDLLKNLIPTYNAILKKISEMGITWVQIDEPILVLDLPPEWQKAFSNAYGQLNPQKLSLLLTTYFGGLEDNMVLAANLPVAGIHIDAVRNPEQIPQLIKLLKNQKVLSLGIIDGRNIWRSYLKKILPILHDVHKQIGERLWIAGSCSLLHCPVDLDNENLLDNEQKNWLAFAKQKISELIILGRALRNGEKTVEKELNESEKALENRIHSKRIHNPAVKKRCQFVLEEMKTRLQPYKERYKSQHKRLQIPLFPTTTIGSFPQTQVIRSARHDYKAKIIDEKQYNEIIKEQIAKAIKLQEELQLDIFVHGEAERNDMVEYFGELLEGFAFTQNGWVQSYGSRCVKPPIIYGDVYRSIPMTVSWITYAQSLTYKPVKGMLTGPITMVCWSFVRDDQPRYETAKQIAFALRDEVADLEKAGIKIIQIDEPAFREGLPLRHNQWEDYLKKAVECFKIASSGVKNETQIHTHMCYADFNDIIESIAELDADVITIETSRSDMELLQAFENFKYPNEIGPGVYDIHSPHIPSVEEMTKLIEKALKYIPITQLWINPDCGLKTRSWQETREALQNMVAAAQFLRNKYVKEKVEIL